MNNEKQIGLGLLQYVQDNDEMTPYLFYGSNGGGSGGSYYKWMDAIFPYVKSEAIFNCPDATYPVTNNAGTFYQYKYYQNLAGLNPAAAAPGAVTGNYYYGSYGYNAMYRNDVAGLNRTPPCGSYGTPQSIAGISSPAATAWILDGTNYSVGWGTIATQPATIVNQNASPKAFNGNGNELVVGWHTDRTDVLYCDGHVKSMTLDALAADTSVGSDGKTTLRQFTIQDD